MKRFQNTFLTLKNSRFFRKILFSFIATFSVIFFVFFLLIVGTLSSRFKDDKIRTNDQSVSHSEQIADSLLKDIYTHTWVLFTEDQTVMQLLYGQSWDTARQLEAIDAVDSIQSSSNYIHSVCLINFSLQKVMTDFQFYSTDDFYDQELLDFLEETPTPPPSPIFFLPRTVNRYAAYENAEASRDAVWSLIYYTTQSGAMVVNIDRDAFSSLLELPSGDDSLFYLLNYDGQVLVSNDASENGSVFASEEILERLYGSSEKSGHFTVSEGGSRYTVSYSSDSPLGLSAVKLEPYTLFDSVRGLLGVALAISALYLLLCLLLALVVSNVLYKPIDHLKTSVLSELPELPDKKSDDEFTMLYRAYHSIAVKNRNLAKYRDAVLSHSQERRLTRFLLGNAAAVTPDAYTELSMLFPEKNFQIVIAELDTQRSDKGELSGQPDDVGLIMFSISNVADELFAPVCAFRRLESNYSRLLYILNFPDGSSFSLPELLGSLQGIINRHFKVSFSLGASPVVQEFDDLPAARTEAENALNRRFIDGFNSIHVSDGSCCPPAGQRYPFELEDELLSAVRGLNPQKAQAALDAFFDKIAAYPYSQIRLYVMWLDYNVQRLEYRNQADPDPSGIDSAYTLPEIRRLLTQRCLSVIQVMDDKKNAGSERRELLGQLNTLIDENLCNPNLSVVFLASEVHLSVNYLRSVYKEQTGESLSGFITQKKLALIYDLLLSTDLTIQEISDRLGFTTKNYFFTFFKKHTGMTPSQYRRVNGAS